MIKEIWINLPVKDISKSRDFFTKIGFSFNPHYGNTADTACLMMGMKEIAVMLFNETMFRNIVQNEVSDATKGTEVLLSFDAGSREEVDELARKVEEAGGNVFAKPAENQGWMYGFAFADLDGHRWNMLYMDMSKMQQG